MFMSYNMRYMQVLTYHFILPSCIYHVDTNYTTIYLS